MIGNASSKSGTNLVCGCCDERQKLGGVAAEEGAHRARCAETSAVSHRPCDRLKTTK